ncbi:MAG: hypothetical protein WCI67_17640 [Chloroflexales bacterium]
MSLKPAAPWPTTLTGAPLMLPLSVWIVTEPPPGAARGWRRVEPPPCRSLRLS